MPLLTTVPRAGLVRIEYVRESSESMSDPLKDAVIKLASSLVVEVIDVTVGASFTDVMLRFIEAVFDKTPLLSLIW